MTKNLITDCTYTATTLLLGDVSADDEDGKHPSDELTRNLVHMGKTLFSDSSVLANELLRASLSFVVCHLGTEQGITGSVVKCEAGLIGAFEELLDGYVKFTYSFSVKHARTLSWKFTYNSLNSFRDFCGRLDQTRLEIK